MSLRTNSRSQIKRTFASNTVNQTILAAKPKRCLGRRRPYPGAISPWSSSSPSDGLSLVRYASSTKSKREEHDSKVAAAQSKILAQLQKKNAPTLSKAERTIILQAVEHWLSKDPSFFVSTMEALDLNNLQKGKIVNENNHSVNRSHPLQVLWDQYRQVYYQSIPEFVREAGDISSRTSTDDGMELQILKQVGFGDPKWSQKYKQVRGYKMNQDQLGRYIARQTKELQKRKEVLAQTLKSQKSLEENLAIKLLSTPQPASSKDFEARTQRKHELEDGRSQEENHDTLTTNSSDVPSTTSFFQRAWALMSSSIFGVDSKERSKNEETLRKHDSSLTENLHKDTAQDDEKDIEDRVRPKRQKRDRNTAARLKKRMERKERAARHLKVEIDALESKLGKIKLSKATSKPPIPLEEYERAQVVVGNARDSICKEFADYIREKHNASIQQYQTLDAKTDLTKPHEWYPYARLDRRKIIFHGGPTNSGKTYSALQRLKEAKKGLYLGPLRLLAAEVYETLTAEGLYTNLFTGQERREIAFSTHTAATVEMCNVTEEYDIVVIDEIQMIADASRGASWTKALMGLRCKEIHVCGGAEAMDIVQKIANACGDDFESISYQRFSDLKVSRSSLSRNPRKKGSYQNVQPGDCIVAFSRNDIFAIKREIESMTNYKCCVIYGKLPPQTRADQARRFNDPDSGYDILVASDAIGMGLNLNIKRIVFNSIFKFNGEKIIRLSHSEIKQISGRAGRRNSPYPNGEVTCLDFRDLGYIRRCLSTEVEPLRKAALVPTEAHIELFAQAIHSYTSKSANESSVMNQPDLHEILRQFSAMATVKGDFFLGRQNEMATIAKRLKNIPIRLRDAYTMCLSPTTESSLKLLESFATKVSQGEVFGLPSRPVPKKAKSFDDLSHLCNIYADVDLFMWLQFKFPPGNAVELAAALARKERTMEYINSALLITEQLKLNHCYLEMSNRHRRVWEAESGRENNILIDDFMEDDEEEEHYYIPDSGYDDRYEDIDDEYFVFEDKEAVY